MAPTVAEFYRGKGVLITGGTGFLGKALLEKLLRTCPGIKTIYLLMRQKKGVTAESRLKELWNNEIFENLRNKQPELFEKLKLIAGDILVEDLGLLTDDRQELQKNGNIIFHSAASVRFDQKLKDAVNMNIKGTFKLLQLDASMENIVAFVHLSTAYSRCCFDVLEEKLYPPIHDPEKIIELVDWMDDDTLNYLEPNDIVPIDISINGCILLSYVTGLEKSKEIKVCNITQSRIDPISWKKTLDIGTKNLREYPFSICLWYPGGNIKSSKLLHDIDVFFTHTIPAYFIDMILILLRKKTYMINIQRRLNLGLQVLRHYTVKEWVFQNDYFRSLSKQISNEDNETFYTDMTVLNWNNYIREYIKGTRLYCCKDDPSTLPQARKLHQKLFLLDVGVKLFSFILFVYFTYAILSKIYYSSHK